MRADIIISDKALFTESATTDCHCHDARLSAAGERVPREVTHQEFD